MEIQHHRKGVALFSTLVRIHSIKVLRTRRLYHAPALLETLFTEGFIGVAACDIIQITLDLLHKSLHRDAMNIGEERWGGKQGVMIFGQASPKLDGQLAPSPVLERTPSTQAETIEANVRKRGNRVICLSTYPCRELFAFTCVPRAYLPGAICVSH